MRAPIATAETQSTQRRAEELASHDATNFSNAVESPFMRV